VPPPRLNHPGGRFRRILGLVALAALAGGVFACYRLGTFLYDEEPLQRADAVCVLAGTRMERPLEAAELYKEGWAPRVILTEEVPDSGIVILRARGLTFPTDAEIARDTLLRLGVPAEAIMLVPDVHDSTAHEAHTFRRLATESGWKRVIVVTSKFHTRRAGFAVRRELKGSGVQVIMRGSRYDRSDPEHWWRTRGGIRWAGSETQKLILYALGLGM
jgi:uncharacterized SAM-binding protein YcdF (DUF218 family)